MVIPDGTETKACSIQHRHPVACLRNTPANLSTPVTQEGWRTGKVFLRESEESYNPAPRGGAMTQLLGNQVTLPSSTWSAPCHIGIGVITSL